MYLQAVCGTKQAILRRRLRVRVKSLGPTPNRLDADKVLVEQHRLAADITKWHNNYKEVVPLALSLIADSSITEDDIPSIEDMTLQLPSDINPRDRDRVGLQALASVELSIRKGEAFNAIREVRSLVTHLAALYQQRRVHIKGVQNMTRAMGIINTATRHRNEAVEDYNHARRSILSLDPTLDKQFPELSYAHLKLKSIEKGVYLGTGREQDSWIWTFGPNSGSAAGELDSV